MISANLNNFKKKLHLDNFIPEIADHIKQEPETHFVLILPDSPKYQLVELKQFNIILKTIRNEWTKSAKLFNSYVVCIKCAFVSLCSQSKEAVYEKNDMPTAIDTFILIHSMIKPLRLFNFF